MIKMNINTNSIRQLKDVRRFLTSFRDENFNEYDKRTSLQFQSCSNVISFLFHKIRELDENYYGDDA